MESPTWMKRSHLHPDMGTSACTPKAASVQHRLEEKSMQRGPLPWAGGEALSACAQRGLHDHTAGGPGRRKVLLDPMQGRGDPPDLWS